MFGLKYSVQCVLVAAFCGIVFAQPRLVIEPDGVWIDPKALNDPNVKTAEPQRVIKRYITVSNEGNSDLTLDYVSSTCGCVSVVECPRVIKAKRSALMELHIDKASVQKVLKDKVQRLYFVTNDPTQEDLFIRVYIKGEQRREVQDVSISRTEISRHLSVDELRSSIVKEQIFVVDRWSKVLKLSNFSSSANIALSSYDITYRCAQGLESHTYRLETKLYLNDKRSDLNEWIEFSTNHPHYPKVRIPITYKTRSQIRVSPKFLVFNRKKNELVRTIKIEWLGDKKEPLSVKQILCDDPWLSVKPRKINANTLEYEVSLESLEDDAGMANRLMRSRIVFKVDQPEENRIIEVKVMVIQ